MNSLMLKSLPVRDPQLLVVGKETKRLQVMVRSGPRMSLPTISQRVRIRARFKHFSMVASYPSERRFSQSGPQVRRKLSSREIFQRARLQPMLGGPLQQTHALTDPQGHQSSLLGTSNGSKSNVVGGSLTINGTLFTIIDVMPGLMSRSGEGSDGYVAAMPAQEVMLQPHSGHVAFWLHVMGRRRRYRYETGAGVGHESVAAFMTDAKVKLTDHRKQQIQGMYVSCCRVITQHQLANSLRSR